MPISALHQHLKGACHLTAHASAAENRATAGPYPAIPSTGTARGDRPSTPPVRPAREAR